MNATLADLIERVLPPESGLRQWVSTFFAARAAREGRLGAKSGAVTAVQRPSSDLRLNSHLHLVVLDGAWYEDGGELAREGLGHLGTSEVGEVLEGLARHIWAPSPVRACSGPWG